MRLFLPLALLALALPVLAQSQPRPLANADVLALLRAGLGPEVVVAKIRQEGGEFDTAPASLRTLKEAGVPEPVIVAMIEAAGRRAPARPAPRRLLPAGTPVQIELPHAVSSADLKEGDLISFRVAAPVLVEGVPVIEAGALATARVVRATGGRAWARGGLLTWALQDVVAVDHQRIPLNATASATGNARATTMTVGIIVTALVFWPAAPLWGFKHGKPAEVPAGRRYEVFTAAEALVGSPAPVAAVSGVAPAPAGSATAEKTCLFGGKPIPCRN